jgi:MoaA/NifB/PqqE/SkfB family radical SAM enzyme
MGPSGVHIFERRSGLNVLLDEVHVPQTSWALAPRFVSIALTDACDLACPYCYAPKGPSRLDFDDLKSWLTELDRNGCLGVGFGGGEPTLYAQLDELCRYAAHNTRLAVSMTTHAHRLDEALLARLAGNIHFVRVSMDGVGPTYEHLRKRSFDQLCGRLESLRAVVPYGINFVVNASTIGDLDRAIEVAAKHGAAEFLLLPERPVRGRNGIESTTLAELKRWVLSYRGPVRLSISQTDATGFPTCDPLALEAGLSAYAHIGASGLVKASSFDNHGVRIEEAGLLHAIAELAKNLSGRRTV